MYWNVEDVSVKVRNETRSTPDITGIVSKCSFSLVGVAVLLALLVLVLTIAVPSDALAWAPATHIEIGLRILENLPSLPESLATLLASQADGFLYGLFACDFQLAKNIKGYDKNSHNWKVEAGLEARASTNEERAFALGCRVHLAGDVICHNIFVPLKLIQTYKQVGRGHAYLEADFDARMPQRAFEKGKVLQKMAADSLDDLHKAAFSETLLPFSTNRRIIRGLARLQSANGWRKGMSRLGSWRNGEPLTEKETDFFLKKSLGAGLEVLAHPNRTSIMRADPTGIAAISEARRLRAQLRRRHKAKRRPEPSMPELMKACLNALELGLTGKPVLPDPKEFVLVSGGRQKFSGSKNPGRGD